MDFEERLKKAVDRGRRTRDEKDQRARAEAMSEEECKRVHSSMRLELTEHIERCLHQLADQFPGFQVESIVDEKGWGTAIVRDDVNLNKNRSRDNLYSRLEVVVRPFNSYHVLDLAAKGTICNKEAFNRNQFQQLEKADVDGFREMIDLWVLEYAESYAATQ